MDTNFLDPAIKKARGEVQKDPRQVSANFLRHTNKPVSLRLALIQAIQNVRSGSITVSMALTREMLNLPRALMPEAIEAIFDCLGAGEVEGEDPGMRITLAYMIVEAISSLESEADYLSADDTLVPLFERYWGALLNWMSIMKDIVKAQIVLAKTTSSSFETIDGIAQTIRCLCFNLTLEKKMLSDNAVFSIVAQLWLLQEYETTSGNPFASEILMRILSQAQMISQSKLGARINELIDIVDGDLDLIVDRAIRRVRLATYNAANIDLHCFVNYLGIMCMLCEGQTNGIHPLRLPFLQKHAVPSPRKLLA